MPFVNLATLLQTPQAFDYVVVGGGTAGLAAATRLSEDPSITVLVLDAGHPNLEDPKILAAPLYGMTFGDPKYDWGFKTTKQKKLDDKEVLLSRGKSLGGSSAMNFACWVKPSAADIDAFEKLGNPGWNWEDYLGYSKKVETFHTPSEEVQNLYPHTFNESFGGTSGPIHVSIPHHIHTIDRVLHPTFVNSGLESNPNPYDGDINGALIGASSINPMTGKRSYAANSYLMPNIGRSNLLVTVEAVVSCINLSRPATRDAELTATGVEVTQGSQTFVVEAKREVIVCAGAINTPKLLELSGIGNPKILEGLNIKPRIDLPGVGENVQEHCFFPVVMELDPSVEHETLDLLRDPVYAEQAFKLLDENKGLLRHGISGFAYFLLSTVRTKEAAGLVRRLEEDLEVLKKANALSPSAQEQFMLQLEAVKDATRPDCEVAAVPGYLSFNPNTKPEDGKRYLSLLGFLNRPFSRGSIHAASRDSQEQPTIDPRYFGVNYDLEILVQQVKYIRDLVRTEPLKGIIAQEVDPGSQVSTDEAIRGKSCHFSLRICTVPYMRATDAWGRLDYIKNYFSTAWHTIGSCSMLPREKDGVVDPNLKVYGTSNLRVADLSIVPLHIVAHTQVTAYVIGEKVADIIKGQHK